MTGETDGHTQTREVFGSNSAGSLVRGNIGGERGMDVFG